MPTSVQDIALGLRSAGYLPGESTALVSFLATKLGKPVLVEGPAGVGKTDAEMMASWSLKHNGQTLFTMPKTVVWRSFVLNHLVHHRGQLSVYLRLNDVPVPAMYGPSADESPNF